MRTLISAVVVLFLLTGLLRAEDDPSSGDEAIKEAITILEARKAQAENKADQDKIAKAIGALEKLLMKPGDPKKADPGKAVEAIELTPALLKKKLAGRAVFNKKIGELTLLYDLKDKNDLKDFDLGDAKPTVSKGVLRVGPADRIKHVVKFKTVKVTGQFFVENIGPGGTGFTPFLQTSPGFPEGVSFGTYHHNGAGLALEGKKLLGTKGLAVNLIEGRLWDVLTFTVTNKRASVRVGKVELAGPNELGALGQVELLGGRGGLQVRSLVISGTLDEEWAKEFFAK